MPRTRIHRRLAIPTLALLTWTWIAAAAATLPDVEGDRPHGGATPETTLVAAPTAVPVLAESTRRPTGPAPTERIAPRVREVFPLPAALVRLNALRSAPPPTVPPRPPVTPVRRTGGASDDDPTPS